MPEILAFLQTIALLLEPTTVRQLGQVLLGMLVLSGRLTMLGLSRWTEKGAVIERSSGSITASCPGPPSTGYFFGSAF